MSISLTMPRRQSKAKPRDAALLLFCPSGDRPLAAVHPPETANYEINNWTLAVTRNYPPLRGVKRSLRPSIDRSGIRPQDDSAISDSSPRRQPLVRSIVRPVQLGPTTSSSSSSSSAEALPNSGGIARYCARPPVPSCCVLLRDQQQHHHRRGGAKLE